MTPTTTLDAPAPLPPEADERHDNSDEIEVLDNLDAIASTEAMLGCGDDNPYR